MVGRDPVTIGVIGVGQIGRHHIEWYAQIPGAKVVAVADIREDALREAREKYGVQDGYLDFRDLLSREDIQAVDVCLHNNLHAPVTIAALEAGKDVYCEKPMAGSYVDALSMFQTARRCGRRLSIQLSTLFSRETRFARRLIDSGRLGRIYYARSTGFRRRGRPFVDGYGTADFVRKAVAGGGALYDMGVYHLAQILYLLGLPKVERISGKIYQETEMDAERQRVSGYDVEELAVGWVRLAGGVTLDLIEAWAVHLAGFEGSFLLGSEGGIRLTPFGYFTTIADVTADVTFDLEAAEARRHALDLHANAYDSPQHHWIAALQGRVPLMPTAETALLTMLVSEGIYLSDQLGRDVTANEVESQSRSTALSV